MTKLNYRRGDILFREGDPSDFVGRIISGDVEVAREHEGETVVLGSAHSGEFIGEMGVIEDRPRSATVRAIDDVELELIGKEDFLKLVSTDSDTALQLLSRLSERLRTADSLLTEAHVQGGDSSEQEVRGAVLPDIMIYAASDGLSEQISGDGILVSKLPFVVGRAPDQKESEHEMASRSADVDLRLENEKPYRLSRMHFLIQGLGEGKYAVRDLGSALGTEVNGQFLGTNFAHDIQEFNNGDNQVVAGGNASLFVFNVVVRGT
jgi:CRP-like cAMP-binding protein